jgi:predicted dienelactone hydrolase
MDRTSLALLGLLVGSGCSRPVPPDATGYDVVTLETVDGEPMPTSIWYPAVAEEGAQPADYVLLESQDAFADLEAATGQFPLVLLSHGNGGSKDASARIAEQLARSGYIVASPDHVGNTYEDGFPSIDGFVEVFLRRPDDLRRVYDHVLAESEDPESPLHERFDGQIAVAGHSTGGSTALLAAGAGINKATIAIACALGEITGLACDVSDATEGDVIFPEFEPLPDVSALLLLAPLSATLLEGEALAGVDEPTLILVGDRDDITPADRDAEPVYASLQGPAGLGILADTGHYGFATLCGVEGLQSLLDDAWVECTDPDYLDPEQLVASTVDLSLSWLGDYAPTAVEPPPPIESEIADHPAVELSLRNR